MFELISVFSEWQLWKTNFSFWTNVAERRYSKNRLNNAENVSCLKSLIRAHIKSTSTNQCEINLCKLDNLCNIFRGFVGLYEMPGWKNGFTETEGMFVDGMLRNTLHSVCVMFLCQVFCGSLKNKSLIRNCWICRRECLYHSTLTLFSCFIWKSVLCLIPSGLHLSFYECDLWMDGGLWFHLLLFNIH